MAGLALWLTKQPPPREDDVAPAVTFEAPPPPPAPPARRSWRRRAALTLAYTTLFFAGGAVVAGAGNQLAQVDPESTDAAVVTTTDTTATDTTTTDATTDTTTTDVTTTDPATIDPTTTTPTTTTETTTLTVAPDPSDATPPAADATAPPAAPASPSASAAPAPRPRVTKHTRTRATAAAVASPFPVLAFDPQAWLVAHAGTPAGDAAVAIAEQYVGVPYRWGGNTPTTGFDCSGLTQFVYAQLGIWLPHYAAAQFLAYPRIDPTQLEPGDLVFFEPKQDGPGHVAIYAGGDAIVEAPHTGADVRVGSLSGAAASLGFLGAVRPSADALVTPPMLQTFAFIAVAAYPPTNWLARAE